MENEGKKNFRSGEFIEFKQGFGFVGLLRLEGAFAGGGRQHRIEWG